MYANSIHTGRYFKEKNVYSFFKLSFLQSRTLSIVQ